jgi:hypothetical protein
MRRLLFILTILLIPTLKGYGQKVQTIKLKKKHFLILKDTIINPTKDTVIVLPRNVKYKKRKDYNNYIHNKYLRQLWDQIYLEKPQSLTIDDDAKSAIESKNPYLLYEGKKIRNIYIKKVDVFGKNINDTVYVKTTMIDKVGDALHEKTKTFVIRNNLFIKNDSIVDENRLSDNERLLRTLPYMHDARIYVRPIEGIKDSVDIEVLVQDIWTLGGSFTPNDVNYYQWKLYDRNFLGYGQTLQYKGQYRSTRNPQLASEFLYSKDNLFGTFINPFVMYSELNGGPHIGKQDENSISAGFNRAIYMPTARLAGGYTFSNNWSVNTQKVTDTTYYDYKYHVHDGWGGVTFSGFKRAGGEYDIITRQNRSRIFLSGRYYNRIYERSPYQDLAINNAVYNGENFILGQASYFKYDYYKTRYIYGFGRTEDIPYGYSYLINSGVDKTLGRVRYYFGTEAFKIWARPSGVFYFIDLSAATFYNTVYKFQDIHLKATGTFVTRVHQMGSWKSRFYFTFNYAKIVNPQLNGGLNINGDNGLQQFSSASLTGYQSSSAIITTNLFPAFKLLGFRFAFIFLAEVAQIGSQSDFIYNNKPYAGMAAGFRTKNENLVFDEFECRVYYFPNAPGDVTTFKIVTLTSPRLRINIKGITQPAFLF